MKFEKFYISTNWKGFYFLPTIYIVANDLYYAKPNLRVHLSFLAFQFVWVFKNKNYIKRKS